MSATPRNTAAVTPAAAIDAFAARLGDSLFPPPVSEIRAFLDSLRASSSSETLADARARTFAEAEKGADCPCCGRLVKRYHNKLKGSMARWLVALCRLSSDGAFVDQKLVFATAHRAESGAHRDDYHLLERWGLTEPEAGDGARAGFWRPTDKGRSFVSGRTSVPAYCVTLYGHVEGFEGDEVTIRDVVGRGFDFAELMHGPNAAALEGAA